MTSMQGPNDMPNPTKISGYLLKKSTAGEWQKRYFETNSSFLTYYKSNKMTKLLAALSLPQVGDIKLIGEVQDAKGTGAIFQLDLKDRQYVLRAGSLEEATTWVNVLTTLRDGGNPDSKATTPATSPQPKNSTASPTDQGRAPIAPPTGAKAPGAAAEFIKDGALGVENCCVIA